MVVDDDVAAVIDFEACRLETQVVRVGPTPERKEQVSADDLPRFLRAVEHGGHQIAASLHADTFGVEAYCHADAPSGLSAWRLAE